MAKDSGDDVEINEEVLKAMGFSIKEIAEIKKKVNQGKKWKEAIAEVMASKGKVKGKEPSKLEEAAAKAMTKFTDIAIEEIGGKPIILLNPQGGQPQHMDLSDFMNALSQFMEKMGVKTKEERKEVDDIKKEIAELRELLEEKEKTEAREELDNLEKRISAKISSLETRMEQLLNKMTLGGTEIDVEEIIKMLNEQGVLSGFLNLANKYLSYKMRQTKMMQGERMLFNAINLLKGVDDVEKLDKALKILKSLYGEEEEFEVVEAESEEK